MTARIGEQYSKVASREDRGAEDEEEELALRSDSEEGDVFEDDYEDADIFKSLHERGRAGESIPLQEKRASRRHRERQKRGEDECELLYNIEEGGQPSQSPSRNTSQENLQLLARSAQRRHRSKRICIHIGIIVLFLTLLYGAYLATRSNREKFLLPLTLSNGTSLFAPTTILVSLDGFRADFLRRGLTPTLNQFIREGVSPLYMMPSFPSVTFPNHYTMVTGLYPESHGIVGNSFWDPADESEFYYTKPQQSLQGKWWGGEPIWLTAERQGVHAAVHMWPGSEAAIGDVPTSHVDKYNGKEDLAIKTERIFHFLDLPGPDSPAATLDNPRPQLIAAYVPNVDSDGHKYGPNSTQIRQTIRSVDEMLGAIFQGLQERNLTKVVNVVVVSDHGMATTSAHRVVQLEDLLDPDDIVRIDGWPLYGIHLKNSSNLYNTYESLKEKTKDMPYLHVYLRDKDMPERYHFSKNPRIAPLWIVPDAGWAIAPRSEFDVTEAKKEGHIYHPRGMHGYDYENSLMRAIFVARGPAFPHPAGSRIDNFQNIELYNIICDTLGLRPAPNNGTLRLPLKPVGHHAEPGAPQIETPGDLPAHETGNISTTVAAETHSIAAITASVSPPATTEVSPSETAPAESPKKGKLHKWWEWIANTFKEAKDRLKGLLGKHKGHA